MPLFDVIGLFVVFLMLLTLVSWGLTRWVARRVEGEVPAQGRYVDLSSVRLHVVEQGEGTPVILLHGLGGQLNHFTYALIERLEGFRVLAVDRPGMGYSAWRNEETADLAFQARCIAELIREERLERPLLVGHSLGGALALRIALDYPELVGGLVLLAPLIRVQPIPGAFRMIAIRSAWLRKAVASTFGIPLSILSARRTLRRIFAPQTPPRDFAHRGGALLGLRPASFSTLSLELSQLNDPMPAMFERYSELNMPIGVLVGEADNLLDPERHGIALAGIVSVTALKRLPGEGHMLPITRPEACAELVRHVAEAVTSRDRVSDQG